MKLKLLSFIAVISIAVLGLTSCSRSYHLQYAGHYHPNTNVDRSAPMNASTLRHQDQMSGLPIAPKDESLTTSNSAELQLVDKSTIVTHPAVHYTFTPQQQKKADKLFDFIEKKANKNHLDWKSPMIQSETRNQSTTMLNKHHADDDKLLYMLLAILLPPLAVALWEDDITVNFWLDILFTLLFWIPGIIFAWIVILT